MKKNYLTVVYLTILAAVAIFWVYQLLPKVVLQCDSELYLKKTLIPMILFHYWQI